ILYVLIRLLRNTFKYSPRFRFRGWSAAGAIFFIETHHILIFLGTFVVMVNPSKENDILNLYQSLARITLVGSIVSIGLLASPRTVLDFLLKVRFVLRAPSHERRVSWLAEFLQQELTKIGYDLPLLPNRGNY